MASNKVLVIDDAKSVRMAIPRMLALLNCEILEAKNGVEGLDLIRHQHPNLILLDFLLPKLSGWEVYQHLQADPKLQKIPLVVMAGNREDVTEKIPQPFDYFEFLEKPFQPQQLINAIQSAINKSTLSRMSAKQAIATNPNQPRSYDAVMGGNTPSPFASAVLGGLEGVKRRLASPVFEQRNAALTDALNYGQPGLDLILETFNNSNDRLKLKAYWLLEKRTEPEILNAIDSFNPYKYFQCIDTLPGEGGGVWSVAISPNSQILATDSFDKTIKLWNLPPGDRDEVATLQRSLDGHNGWVSSVAFSSNGEILASGSSDGTINIWNLQNGEQIRTLKGHIAWVSSIAFSPDGTTLISGSKDATIKLWNPYTGELRKTLKEHSSWVNSVAISPDGTTLVSGSNDETIRIWNLDTKTGTAIASDAFTLQSKSGWVNSVAISPDGQILASGSNYSAIHLWNLDTKQGTEAPSLQRTLKRHSTSVRCLVFSPNSQILASGSNDGIINIWDLQSKSGEEAIASLEHNLTGNLKYVRSLAFSPNGDILASGGNDGTIKVWGVR
ncbi:response regulator [Microcoleus sp. FACHB-831]|uniref:WD40 domain-containing protein n=1 Tax=Microcoleus sp. FACHB-831 TaxID=2692827 RepID=UPI00168718B5|nr:response regulator [Microcoleus sp. FACHB-831]MBD1923451.1 response regulator [Microcoleus sp. FACHB-831]